MKISFRNAGGPPIWVTVMVYAPGACAGQGDWQTIGWWFLRTFDPVETVHTSNRYFTYFAEAIDGAFWAGEYGAWVVDHNVSTSFALCREPVNTQYYRFVGTRLKYAENDLQINLVRS